MRLACWTASVLLAAPVSGAGAQNGPHAQPAQHPGGAHGNPADLDTYVARLADPARDAWQKPDEVVRHLALRPGQVVCDVGSGPGYFTFRLARAVAPGGRVYAVDVEAGILEALRKRLAASGARNVVPVLALPEDPLLPDGVCDLVFVVDTYHHFPDRVNYLRRLARALRPGGRLVNIDYEKRETPVGPPQGHRLAREVFVEEARQAGYVVVGEPAFLPHQYFVVLRAR